MTRNKNAYYYLDEPSFIRIWSFWKPKKRDTPYKLQKFVNGEWQSPCFPEITWRRLSEMRYIGKETPNY